jgi:hypothetical protein
MGRVRANRAYLAGFGTAGSLLAGAAALFVLGSAVVAFRGWPQVGEQSPPTTVVNVSAGAPTDSTAVKRLVAVAAAQSAAAASPGVVTRGGRGSSSGAGAATISGAQLGERDRRQ